MGRGTQGLRNFLANSVKSRLVICLFFIGYHLFLIYYCLFFINDRLFFINYLNKKNRIEQYMFVFLLHITMHVYVMLIRCRQFFLPPAR